MNKEEATQQRDNIRKCGNPDAILVEVTSYPWAKLFDKGKPFTSYLALRNPHEFASWQRMNSEWLIYGKIVD